MLVLHSNILFNILIVQFSHLIRGFLVFWLSWVIKMYFRLRIPDFVFLLFFGALLLMIVFFWSWSWMPWWISVPVQLSLPLLNLGSFVILRSWRTVLILLKNGRSIQSIFLRRNKFISSCVVFFIGTWLSYFICVLIVLALNILFLKLNTSL